MYSWTKRHASSMVQSHWWFICFFVGHHQKCLTNKRSVDTNTHTHGVLVWSKVMFESVLFYRGTYMDNLVTHPMISECHLAALHRRWMHRERKLGQLVPPKTASRDIPDDRSETMWFHMKLP